MLLLFWPRAVFGLTQHVAAILRPVYEIPIEKLLLKLVAHFVGQVSYCVQHLNIELRCAVDWEFLL